MEPGVLLLRCLMQDSVVRIKAMRETIAAIGYLGTR